MNRLDKNLIISLTEGCILSSKKKLSIKQHVFLLSVGLQKEQIQDLNSALNNLKDKKDFIVRWSCTNENYEIELAEEFPIPEVSSIEIDKIKNLRIRRILLFRLYEEYLKTNHQFVHFPLVTMAGSLEVSSDDIMRHVLNLASQYYLEYEVADGGQCTSDFTEHGIELCETQDVMFDQFSAIKMQLKTEGNDEYDRYEGNFISDNRINELIEIKTTKFDLIKLVQFCKEANIAYKNGCLLSLAMIQRAILNYIPPIMGYKTFLEVANNYNGGRSFKQLMERLENSLRKVADSYIHQPIKQKETLPELPQVDFKTEIDILLSEIIIILR